MWDCSFIFREYAANLRIIDWDGDEDVIGFADLQKCAKLRRLKSRNLNTATLVSLLKACGSTLEHLDISITPVCDSVEVMEAIRNYCKQWSVINIENLEDVMNVAGRESYCSLIRSYGSQLKNAKTDRLSHKQLTEVVNACTNLEVPFYSVNGAGIDWQRVYHLGPRVRSLFFRSVFLFGHIYPRALEQCSNLRNLSLFAKSDDETPRVTDEMMTDLFSPSRYPQLEKLMIMGFRANVQNMALIASCTANLKSAFFVPFQPDSGLSVFQVIADSNKNLTKLEWTSTVLVRLIKAQNLRWNRWMSS